jgi:CubicO group peptidase (beta-lactamase class C family)
MRMWSMSKPVTAVATLLALQRAGSAPSRELMRAMTRAITRSENCPQRRMVVELQTLTGGSRGALAALRSVLATAGVTDAEFDSATVGPDPACRSYLAAQRGVRDPLGPALQIGVTDWTVRDAARFAAALGEGRYGAAGTRVLTLMRRPKGRSAEESLADYTPHLDWGAGAAFAGLDPAYKAGWGGTQQASFMAGQYAVVRVAGHMVAVAAMFHPRVQPPLDDPGRTNAPDALAAIFTKVKSVFGVLEPAG